MINEFKYVCRQNCKIMSKSKSKSKKVMTRKNKTVNRYFFIISQELDVHILIQNSVRPYFFSLFVMDKF